MGLFGYHKCSSSITCSVKTSRQWRSKRPFLAWETFFLKIAFVFQPLQFISGYWTRTSVNMETYKDGMIQIFFYCLLELFFLLIVLSGVQPRFACRAVYKPWLWMVHAVSKELRFSKSVLCKIFWSTSWHREPPPLTAVGGIVGTYAINKKSWCFNAKQKRCFVPFFGIPFLRNFFRIPSIQSKHSSSRSSEDGCIINLICFLCFVFPCGQLRELLIFVGAQHQKAYGGMSLYVIPNHNFDVSSYYPQISQSVLSRCDC